MGGLARICRMHGGMTLKGNGETVEWVWDYVKEAPRLKSEMTAEEIAASEKAKWEKVRQQNATTQKSILWDQ